MNRILVFHNEQMRRGLNLRLLRNIIEHLLINLLEEDSFELGFHFVRADKMAEVNEMFLQHSGSTDVITFDYAEKGTTGLHGEIFICIDDTLAQAKEFNTTWQSELTRYVVHSILHLKGFDDLQPAARKKMKAEEDRLVNLLEKTFVVRKLRESLATATKG